MTFLLEARDITKRYGLKSNWLQKQARSEGALASAVVQGVSLELHPRRTLGLVGESGSGKSTIGRMLVGLEHPTSGSILFQGKPLTGREAGALQMIFQDPMASLNPSWKVEDIVAEPLRWPRPLMARQARSKRVGELLEAVGLVASDAMRYPHQFSGGQRQRISIARALASEPALLVCDEPTSALDVSVQAQVLNLMQDLQTERGLSYLFISHNLAVVRHVADEVAVLFAGRVVERAPAEDLFSNPLHPYTRALLDAVPGTGRREQPPGESQVGTSPVELPMSRGCAYRGRCPLAGAQCALAVPALSSVDAAKPAHSVACHVVSGTSG